MKNAAAAFPSQPLVSVITPAYNTEPRWLETCARSVIEQFYPRWEWHIVNDGSNDPATLEAFSRVADLDSRITIHHLERNLGIANASNVALQAVSGEYIALLDHDDALAPRALFRVVEHLLRTSPPPDVLYSDEDKIEMDGTQTDAYFKPDWSPELLLSNMYAGHLLVFRRECALEVGGFRSEFDLAQDYDLMLRLIDRANRIDHVADVLYHWRKVAGSTAAAGAAKPSAHAAGRRALQDYLDRHQIAGEASDAGAPGFYRINYLRATSAHHVSVVGPRSSDDRERLRQQTSDVHFEFIDAAINATTGPVLILDPSFEPQSPDWLSTLIEALRPGVGVAGPMLLRADGRVEHAGIALGFPGIAGRPLLGAPRDTFGYFGSGTLIRNVAAVSGACLLTTTATLASVGAPDTRLGSEAAALDYCLRVRAAGERVVFTPGSVLKRRTEAAVPALSAADADVLRERWGAQLERDPYYNRHLSRRFLDYRVDVESPASLRVDES